MGKRKRHAKHGARKIESSDDAKGYEGRQDEVHPLDKAARSTMSSKEAFRHERMNASEERRSELGRVEQPTDMQAEHRPKRKKKHKKKRKSQHDSKVPSSTANATTTDTLPDVSNHANSTVADDLDDPLLPRGLSRHQRRRWRRKLISHGLMSNAQREGSASQTTPKPPTEERKAVAWADKPIGRKALAKHLATTTLMQPPIRRWEGHQGAPAGNADDSTPWQCSAAKCGNVILSESMGGDTDAKSVVSGAADVSGVPKIHTSSQRAPRPSATTESIASNNSLRLRLPTGLGASARPKRHSFGSKANSVPTYTVQGDVAERFRRFSAAVHGKAVDGGGDESSDSSSESSSEEDALSVNNVVEKDEGDEPDCSNHRGSHAGHEANAKKASQISISSEYRGLRTMAELMSPSRKPRLANARNKRSAFGSTNGGGGLSKRRVAEPDKDDSQTSVHGDSQSIAGISPIDDEAFDTDQAVQDVFEIEMMLTRELPAGKKAPIPNTDLEREGGLLTQDFSGRRLTRSAFKAKPDMLVKRTDSAIPDLGSNVVIVQSMQLPESIFGGAQRESRSEGAGAYEIEGDAVDGTASAGTQATGAALARRRSSSQLSELSRSPTPPQQRFQDQRTCPDEQPQQLAVGTHEEHHVAVATAKQASEPKKKRKMTGLTSKHFSTPNTKRNTKQTKKQAPATEIEQEAVSTTPAHRGSGKEDLSHSERRKRTTSTKALPAETRNLLDDASPTAAQASSQRPKKRPRPSGGKITDLSDANIIESRSRHPNGMGRDLNQPEKVKNHPRDATSDDVASDVQHDITEDNEAAELSSKRVKRSRRSGGTLANLSSNIFERGSTRSIGNAQVEDSHLDDAVGQARPNDQDEYTIHVTPEPDYQEAESKPKKRSRPSGGKITDLDSSNIIGSQRRERRRSGKTATAQKEVPDKTETTPVAAPGEQAPSKPKAKRKSTGKRSMYFTPPKPPLHHTVDRVDHFNTTGKRKRGPAGVSIAPVPSIHSDRFGIIQEKLWREPFWLLIAVTFLNKTAGRAAAPVFWQLKEKYQTPEALAEANPGELLDMIWHLGLQQQRSKRLIAMAKAWVERQPEAGVRWRVLHYPEKGDGKGYKADSPIEEDADDISGAIEIGHIPGCGPYAMDSWRIFCRDVLRGVAEDYNGNNAEAEGFVPEWQKVLPGDKELRACLRWMWLREGWIWEHESGSKRRATESEMEAAVRGEMEVADEGEGRFAARAAGVEGGEGRVKTEAGEGEGEGEGSGSPVSGGGKGGRGISRGTKQAAAPEMDRGEDDDDGSSDNIVVGLPAKRRRTSRRITT